jgi:biotin synthase
MNRVETTERASLIRAEGSLQASLHERARGLREENFGKDIFIRGVVEVSNFCRENCSYCGMRRDNKSLERYRISLDQLLDTILNHRPSSITDINIQAGEDPIAVRQIVLPLIREIRRRTNLGVSVCLGTLSREDYAQLRETGASYYIIKLETGDPELYRQVLAPGTLTERIQAIRHLASTGWTVSSGLILGLPGQTEDHVLKTIELLEDLPLTGCSVSPFIPGQQTPLAASAYGSQESSINCLALMRILMPRRIIPAVSAMTFQEDGGYQRAINAGANLATINLTPPNFRRNYPIYKRDRLIMNEEKVLKAIEEAGCRGSGQSLHNFLQQRSLRVETLAAVSPNGNGNGNGAHHGLRIPHLTPNESTE